MPNNYLSVLYKHIIQVENENVGLKVGRGWAQTYHCPPPPPAASYASVHWRLTANALLFVDKVLHDWCNKGRGMCYPVLDGAYKRTLAVNRNE